MERKLPRLRTVEKSVAPYPLNKFPANFGNTLGKELIYLLATKGRPTLEGSEWEEVFATCINADWFPSNVGLDDIVLGNTAWGAKTVKAPKPSKQASVRLISGRNSPLYSFGHSIDTNLDPEKVGISILDIWNERVSSVREKYKQLRTVVLIKSSDLSEVVVFEFETIRYDPELFSWHWNKNGNLEGVNLKTKKHCFTWQPHGSQFTIIEDVPNENIIINIKKPSPLKKEGVLELIGYDKSWVSITPR
jgi:hypothetical protein